MDEATQVWVNAFIKCFSSRYLWRLSLSPLIKRTLQARNQRNWRMDFSPIPHLRQSLLTTKYIHVCSTAHQIYPSASVVPEFISLVQFREFLTKNGVFLPRGPRAWAALGPLSQKKNMSRYICSLLCTVHNMRGALPISSSWKSVPFQGRHPIESSASKWPEAFPLISSNFSSALSFISWPMKDLWCWWDVDSNERTQNMPQEWLISDMRTLINIGIHMYVCRGPHGLAGAFLLTEECVVNRHRKQAKSVRSAEHFLLLPEWPYSPARNSCVSSPSTVCQMLCPPWGWPSQHPHPHEEHHSLPPHSHWLDDVWSPFLVNPVNNVANKTYESWEICVTTQA